MFEDFYKKYKEDIKNCFKDLKDKDKRIKQIPNLLTASRLLAPLFIVPAAFSGNIPLAILFTCLFEATDALDGFAARKLNAVSEFGKDLDPIVDKIFAAGLMIPLIIKFPAVTACIFNEALIGKKNIESKKKGNVPRTTLLGKFKTLLLSINLRRDCKNSGIISIIDFEFKRNLFFTINNLINCCNKVFSSYTLLNTIL